MHKKCGSIVKIQNMSTRYNSRVYIIIFYRAMSTIYENILEHNVFKHV